MIEEIKEAWGWVGLDPAEIVGENDFGNLIIKDASGKYWRLCPEEVYCKVVAESRDDLDALSHSQEFLADWYMSSLIEVAKEKLGHLPKERKYCLKIPGILGGEYNAGNIGVISQRELISFSGYLGKEIKDLPDGAKIKFSFVE
jgi:hypothetical protein